MTTSLPLLEMKHMTKRFPGVLALDNAQLTLKPGTVHALMGENGAGKSTLMKCLFGIYRPDEGEIRLQGKPIMLQNSHQALTHGISMVHQELNQIPKMSVADNMWLGRYQTRGFAINDKAVYKKTQEVFDALDIKINPKAIVESLPVSDRQMFEIAKASSFGGKIIVMDEPTSSLTETEVLHLFDIIRQLKERGCGIIYISHKMEEILKIADDVTIMRDGKWIATKPAADLTIDMIITMMVGRELTNRFPPKTHTPGDILLEVENLGAVHDPLMKDVSFTLREGEILGVSGLDGSKRTEVVETLFGVRKKKSGKVSIRGKVCNHRNSKGAIKHGLALLTEERRRNGIFPGLSVEENAVIANLKAYCNCVGVTDGKKINKDTDWVIERLKVKTASKRVKISTLSGGNQQKVILGKWLLTSPDVLLLDEPTRGIDVGAKYEIYQLILELANDGKGVIMISSEMPELLGITDRILVMSNGKVAGIVETSKTNQNELLRLAAKYL